MTDTVQPSSPSLQLPDVVRDDAIRTSRNPAQPPDALARIRKAVSAACNLELDIRELEERLVVLRRDLHRLSYDDIPTLMLEAGVSEFTLKAQGNLPARRVRVEPYFSAGVPVGWPDEKRRAAFAALAAHDGDWMIKTAVEARFAQHARGEAKQFMTVCDNLGLDYTAREVVHQAQLTKWLKERVQDGKPIPPLDVIGGSMGQRATIKAVDTDQ